MTNTADTHSECAGCTALRARVEALEALPTFRREREAIERTAKHQRMHEEQSRAEAAAEVERRERARVENERDPIVYGTLSRDVRMPGGSVPTRISTAVRGDDGARIGFTIDVVNGPVGFFARESVWRARLEVDTELRALADRGVVGVERIDFDRAYDVIRRGEVSAF